MKAATAFVSNDWLTESRMREKISFDLSQATNLRQLSVGSKPLSPSFNFTGPILPIFGALYLSSGDVFISNLPFPLSLPLPGLT